MLFTSTSVKPIIWVITFSLVGILFAGAEENAVAVSKKKFKYRVLEKPILLKVTATAYTHTEADHIGYGRVSAYGNSLKTGENYHSAAADWSFLPIGSVFRIKGFSTLFVVDDYGSALNGKKVVDIYFETKKEMNEWGAPKVEIEILRIGDFRASYLILRQRAAKHRHCYDMAKRIFDRIEAEKKE